MRRLITRLPLILLIVCLAGCGSGLTVTSMQLGRSLNTDDTVAGHTSTFKPNETVYVSISTTGAGSGVIGVRWTYGERVVGEPKKEVSYRGEAATEFHLQNAGGFPPGEYKVEAFLDGQPVGSRTFRVDAER